MHNLEEKWRVSRKINFLAFIMKIGGENIKREIFFETKQKKIFCNLIKIKIINDHLS